MLGIALRKVTIIPNYREASLTAKNNSASNWLAEAAPNFDDRNENSARLNLVVLLI
jgi:hypothetical protein